MREAELTVALGARSYPVHIGAGLLEQAGALLAPHLARPYVAVVSEERVGALHLEALRAGLAASGIEAEVLILPPGEGTKGWAGLERTVEWLIARRVERRDMVLALGGGVIGDLAGFAAAILRRGVRFAQAPTTLLAQVDSAVGGKTGINSAHGKNLIGAFHQPLAVIADIATLDTLPERDFLAGYGEVVKYGALGDADFFAWLEARGPALAAGDRVLRAEAVRRSCAIKAGIVARDEREAGERALLNLGHTFGHALEAATGYSDRLLHGEGVAIGMALAFDLSARMGLSDPAEGARLVAHLRAMGMKAGLGDIPGALPDAAALIALMGQDKKVVGGALHLVLARGIGRAFVTAEVPEAALKATLDQALATRRG